MFKHWLIQKLTGNEPVFGSKAGYKYGYKKDKVDTRDHLYVPAPETIKTEANEVDLRSQDAPLFDQGQLGSCTANAILGLFAFVCLKLFGGAAFIGSRLMLYFNERVMEGNPDEDAGAEIRDGMTSLNKDGVCPETMWPYDIDKFAQKPPAKCYTSGQQHKSTTYMRVAQDLAHMKACLAEGFPFAFGFEVYASFESAAVARTGVVPMPKKGEKLLGGHAVVAVGYIDDKGKAKFNRVSDMVAHHTGLAIARVVKYVRTGNHNVATPKNVFICRNSWGIKWGDKGYFYMPYAYMTSSKCDDFWTIRVATDGKDGK